jgi:hypothetical protein
MDVHYWYIHGICHISGRRQKKTPKCRYVIYPARPTLLVYTWNLPYIRPEAKKPPQVQICNISGRMQKKPPRCKYVMYSARPTLLLYTWNLPYIRPEAKKTPQVQICNISGQTYIIGIHMESAIYPAGGKKTPPGADM